MYFISGDKLKTLGDVCYRYTGVTNAFPRPSGFDVYQIRLEWAMCVCSGVAVESLTVATDTLGYVSTVGRNSKHIQLLKTEVNSAMSGGERAKKLGSTMVMMQDVTKPWANVGHIALGIKQHDKAKKLEPGRLYR